MSTATHAPLTAVPNGITVTPIGGKIGAEIRGIEVSGSLPSSTIELIRQAVHRFKVVILKTKVIDDATQEAFAALWGRSLIEHPTIPSVEGTQAILDVDGAKGNRASNWHADFTFAEAYPSVTILRPIVLPERGGDTLWANTVAAYDEMPEPLKGLADSLWALHTNDYDYAGTRSAPLRAEGIKQFNEVFTKRVYQTEHPLVRVHPVTGEKSLIVGNFIQKILGVNSSESRHLLEIFHDRATKPENTLRWHWSLGDIAIWDNYATIHRAVDDYGDLPRIARRTTLVGEPPVSVDGRRSRSVAITSKAELQPIAAE